MSKNRRWFRCLLIYPLGSVALLDLALFIFVTTTRFSQQSQSTAPQALIGGRVLFGPDLQPQDDVTVLIRDGLIDLAGTTLLPGLIDIHVHLAAPGAGADLGWRELAGSVLNSVRHAPSPRRELLENGVTSVRSLGDDPTRILELRRLVDERTLEGARIFAADPMISTVGGHPTQSRHGGHIIDGLVALPGTPKEARAMVVELAARDGGVDAIKVVMDRGPDPARVLEPLSAALLATMMAEAALHDLPVIAHWGDTSADLTDLVAVGVDGIEHFGPHGQLLQGWPTDQFHELASSGSHIGPTLALIDAAGDGWPDETTAALRQRLMELHASGAPIIAGTDAPLNGLAFGVSLHRELELLVGFGLTPRQTLQAATSTAAEALRTTEIGAIEPGRTADQVAVRGDPLADISMVREVSTIWREKLCSSPGMLAYSAWLSTFAEVTRSVDHLVPGSGPRRSAGPEMESTARNNPAELNTGAERLARPTSRSLTDSDQPWVRTSSSSGAEKAASGSRASRSSGEACARKTLAAEPAVRRICEPTGTVFCRPDGGSWAAMQVRVLSLAW